MKEKALAELIDGIILSAKELKEKHLATIVLQFDIVVAKAIISQIQEIDSELQSINDLLERCKNGIRWGDGKK